MLVKFLIIFFVVLLIYQIFLAHFYKYTEGMENQNVPTSSTSIPQNNSPTVQYQSYPEDPLILSKQNAANIDFLKGRVDELADMKKQVYDISLNVSTLNDQVNVLFQQQQTYAQNINGGEPIEISGTDTGDITNNDLTTSTSTSTI